MTTVRLLVLPLLETETDAVADGFSRGETCPMPLLPCSVMDSLLRLTWANETDEVSISSASTSIESSHPPVPVRWGVSENELDREERVGKGRRRFELGANKLLEEDA